MAKLPPDSPATSIISEQKDTPNPDNNVTSFDAPTLDNKDNDGDEGNDGNDGEGGINGGDDGSAF